MAKLRDLDKKNHPALKDFPPLNLDALKPIDIVELCEKGSKGGSWDGLSFYAVNDGKNSILEQDYFSAKYQTSKGQQHNSGREPKYEWDKFVEFLIEGYVLENIHKTDALILHAKAEYKKKFKVEPNYSQSKKYALAVRRALCKTIEIVE